MRTKKTILILVDILILEFSFLLLAWIKPGTRSRILPNYFIPLLFFIFLWIVISLISGKYNSLISKGYSDIFSSIVRSDFTIISFITIFIFTLKIFRFSRLIIIGTFLLSFLLELLLGYIFFIHRKFNKKGVISNENIFSKPTEIKPLEKFNKKKSLKINIPDLKINEIPILKDLQTKYLRNNEELFNFIQQYVPLKNINKDKSVIIDTHTFYNVSNYDEKSLQLLINLHKINDIRRVNKFIIQINKNLVDTGIFIGCGISNNERYKYFFLKFPKLLAVVLYSFDFIIRRIFPKLPILQDIYFSLTKGKNRAISKAELLGRLYYCGFSVIETKEINNMNYFIAMKTSESKNDGTPSYGPIFKMRRRGKNGEIIYVYKFRTMHPYSEYLQHYMVEKYGYGKKGKIENDFRVTTWGKFMRKLWMDELPQLINILKGEMKLVGVRPLSERFLSEYPPELIEERFKTKPGCIPPYVALGMQSIDEGIEAERIYLQERKKHPYMTDIKFFLKAVFNIVTNKIRSE